MEDLEILVRVPFESQGVALDWVVEKYLKHDLLSIIYQEKDENECHVFKVTLRSKKSPAELDDITKSMTSSSD
jgi:hypothetical protein